MGGKERELARETRVGAMALQNQGEAQESYLIYIICTISMLGFRNREFSQIRNSCFS